MSQYMMRGADGAEYGPVDEATLRRWMDEGRANASTHVKKDDQDWMPLGKLPEFSSGGGLKVKKREPAPAQTPVAAQAPAETSVEGMLGQTRPGESKNERMISDLAATIASASLWISLLAIMLFLNALVTALSIIGLLIAWLPAWMGFALWGATSKAKDAMLTGDPEKLDRSLGNLKTYFVINGVLILLGLLFVVAWVVFMIAVVGATSSEGFQEWIEEMMQQAQQSSEISVD